MAWVFYKYSILNLINKGLIMKLTNKEKIDKARAKNPIQDYFLNPHFEEVATKKEKKFVEDHFEFITIK